MTVPINLSSLNAHIITAIRVVTIILVIIHVIYLSNIHDMCTHIQNERMNSKM